MSIGSICTRDVVTVDASATLQQAARLMREHHVGALLVVVDAQSGQQVAGIVTDRDLVVEAMARGVPADSVRVGALVGKPLVAIAETASLDEAIAMLQSEGVRRLLVATTEGALAGIVSLDDVLDAIAARMVALAEAMHRGIARESAQRGPIGPAQPLHAIQIPTRPPVSPPPGPRLDDGYCPAPATARHRAADPYSA